MKRERNRKGPYFKHIFFSILGITILVTSLLGVVLFNVYKKNLADIVHKASQLVLEQVGRNAEVNNRVIRSFTASLSTNPQAVSLYASKRLTSHETLTAINSINLSLKNFPSVHSVYLYNGYTETIYMMGNEVTHAPLHSFFDVEIVEKIEKLSGRGLSLPFTRTVNYSHINDREISVYSYMINERYSYQNQQGFAIVVNVDLDFVFNSLQEEALNMPEGRVQNNFLIFSDSTIIGATEGKLLVDEERVATLMERIHAEENRQGSITTTLDSQRYIIDFLTMDFTDWKIANIVPESYFQEFSQRFIKATTLIILFSSVLSVLFAYLFSRKLYNPVKETMQTLKTLASGMKEKEDKNSEFFKIQGVLKDSWESINALSVANYRSRRAAIRETIWQQIHTGKYSRAEFLKRTEEYGFFIAQDKSVCIMLTTLGALPAASEFLDDNALARFAMENILWEVVGYDFQNETFFIDNKMAISVIICQDREEERIYQRAEEARKNIEDVFSCEISCFISSIQQDVGMLTLQYDETIALKKEKFMQGESGVLTQKNAKERPPYTIKDVDISIIRQLLLSGTTEEMERELDILFADFTPYSCDTILFAATYLVVVLLNDLREFEKNSRINLNISDTEYVNSILEQEYLYQVRDLVFKLCSQAIEEREKARNQVQISIAESVRQVIELRLAQEDLSINELAEQYYMTPASLNRIYKASYGTSVQEEITTLRLEQAERFLRTSDLTVNEITSQIGWSNSKYFYTQFRNKNGLTPKEYRAYHAIQSSAEAE